MLKLFKKILLVLALSGLCQQAQANFGNESKLTPSIDLSNDAYGYSIDIDGDIAIVGAYRNDDNGTNSGAAYIFVRDTATGIWSEQQKIIPTDIAEGDNFGISVSVSGETVVIGSAGDDDIASGAGSAYVYTRNATTWSLQQKLFASDGDSSDGLGGSVSIDGDSIMVSAVADEDNGGQFTGSAYFYTRSGTLWTEQQKIQASDFGTGQSFGRSLSFSENLAVVTGGGIDPRIYIFTLNSGVWSEQQIIQAPTSAGISFANKLSISGNTIVVSSSGEDSPTGEHSFGAVYVYDLNTISGLWELQQKLRSSDGHINQSFGSDVAIDHDRLLVGALGDNDNATSSGAAYIFDRIGGIWSQSQKILASDGSFLSTFGFEVALSGDNLITGAANSTQGTDWSGTVYAYTFNAGTGASTSPQIAISDSTLPADNYEIDFGQVAEFSQANETLTISNLGDDNLSIGNIAATDVLNSPFSIVSDNCSGQSLTLGSSCAVTVRFEPDSSSTFSDSFDITSNDPNNPSVIFSTIGTGVGSSGSPNSSNTNTSGGGSGGKFDLWSIFILVGWRVWHMKTRDFRRT